MIRLFDTTPRLALRSKAVVSVPGSLGLLLVNQELVANRWGQVYQSIELRQPEGSIPKEEEAKGWRKTNLSGEYP